MVRPPVRNTNDTVFHRGKQAFLSGSLELREHGSSDLLRTEGVFLAVIVDFHSHTATLGVNESKREMLGLAFEFRVVGVAAKKALDEDDSVLEVASSLSEGRLTNQSVVALKCHESRSLAISYFVLQHLNTTTLGDTDDA